MAAQGRPGRPTSVPLPLTQRRSRFCARPRSPASASAPLARGGRRRFPDRFPAAIGSARHSGAWRRSRRILSNSPWRFRVDCLRRNLRAGSTVSPDPFGGGNRGQNLGDDRVQKSVSAPACRREERAQPRFKALSRDARPDPTFNSGSPRRPQQHVGIRRAGEGASADCRWLLCCRESKNRSGIRKSFLRGNLRARPVLKLGCAPHSGSPIIRPPVHVSGKCGAFPVGPS